MHDARVVGLFSTQTTLFEQISQAKWTFQFTPRCPSTRPSERNLYSSLRTFSGRRRAGDVHDRLLFWANQVGIRILVLSLDTANSTTYGDLHPTSTTWTQSLRLYKEGRTAATITGAPCETWSAARHHMLVDDEGNPLPHQPRLLRDRKASLAGQVLLLGNFANCNRDHSFSCRWRSHWLGQFALVGST